MSVRLSADDFFAGLFAGLAYRGKRRISVRGSRFDEAVAEVVSDLEARYGDEINLRFRVRPHYIHGGSTTVRDAIAAATQADLISLDNPEYQDIRFKIGPSMAERILSSLPLEKDVFLEVADDFLRSYEQPGASALST